MDREGGAMRVQADDTRVEEGLYARWAGGIERLPVVRGQLKKYDRERGTYSIFGAFEEVIFGKVLEDTGDNLGLPKGVIITSDLYKKVSQKEVLFAESTFRSVGTSLTHFVGSRRYDFLQYLTLFGAEPSEVAYFLREVGW